MQNPSCVSALKKCDNVDLQQSRQPSLGLGGRERDSDCLLICPN